MSISEAAKLIWTHLTIVCNMDASCHAHNTQKLSLLRPAMLIQVLCKNVLHLTSSALSLYFKRSQTFLPTFLFKFIITTFDVQLSAKCIFWQKLCIFSLQISPSHLNTPMNSYLLK